MKYNEKGKLVLDSIDDLTETVLSGKYEEVDRDKHHKHNAEYITIVFSYEGKNWMTTYFVEAYDGIQWYGPLTCDQVEKKEVVVSKWVTV